MRTISLMAEYTYECEIELPRPREEVFPFFAKAENLETITPPELGFRILTPLPIEMGEGTLIDYQISLHGIPMKWRTEITHWDPPYEFEDTQLSGPYKQWIHRHTFIDTGRGTTLMKDVVRYRLPFEPLGDVMQWVIHRQVTGIFDHRQRTISSVFKYRHYLQRPFTGKGELRRSGNDDPVVTPPHNLRRPARRMDVNLSAGLQQEST